MIGIFGLRCADPAAPADLRALSETVPQRYRVDEAGGRGGALGIAAHRGGFPDGWTTSRTGAEVVVTGAIFNVGEFAIPDVRTAAALVSTLYDQDELSRLAQANGQFAAAIYDRAHHRLVLITDRMATTAIHVWRSGDEVVFATQLYTLLGDRRIKRKPDRAAIAQLFTMQRTIGDTTPIAGVVALPAACIATFEGSKERQHTYRLLEWKAAGFDDDEGAAMLADALRRAVSRQSVGQRNGLLLSGGVDSRMVLAAAPEKSLTCWTTAGYEHNPELKLAQRVAELFGAQHTALIVDPADTLSVHDNTVVESGGLYPASNPMSAFLSKVGEQCDVLLTGHGLDYTLRGYYLPARFARIGGSKTRLPALRPRAARPSGADVFDSLRQGPPRPTIERIVRPECSADWWRGQEGEMESVLRPWLDSSEPYNAWDAFILHAVNKHYAFTGMMAARAVSDLAIPAFDDEVLNVYLGMTPQARVSGRVVHKAIRIMAPEAASLPNANTDFPADLNPWLEVAALLVRGGLRRVGLTKRASLPSPMHSAGSWQNIEMLYRAEPGHRTRFQSIRRRLDSLTCGILNANGLAACIDEHLEGRAAHTKLLRQLLMHDAWVSRFGIEAST
jgi:asparagine synthetase B (glutamine-hydrolysing)